MCQGSPGLCLNSLPHTSVRQLVPLPHRHTCDPACCGRCCQCASSRVAEMPLKERLLACRLRQGASCTHDRDNLVTATCHAGHETSASESDVIVLPAQRVPAMPAACAPCCVQATASKIGHTSPGGLHPCILAVPRLPMPATSINSPPPAPAQHTV